MTHHEAPEAFPGLDVFEELLSHGTDQSEPSRHLACSHGALPHSNPEADGLFEEFVGLLSYVQQKTGWDVADALHVVGCTQDDTELNVEHLRIAVRQITRLAESVADLAEIAGGSETVDLAFRITPGDTSASLRSMATDPWLNVYLDARDFVASHVYGQAGGGQKLPASRAALTALLARSAG